MIRQRQRDVVSIRADAINMAIKKALEGCLGCAESYFKLARQHGATEEDIERAITDALDEGRLRVSRRDVLKLAALGAASLAVVNPTLDLTVASASTSLYFGTDGNANSCCGIPQDFYVGQLGHGLTTTNPPVAFNPTGARQAGYNQSYAYWTLEGPINNPHKPTNVSPAAWGQMQGQAAVNAYNSGQYASYVGGTTLFADIEQGNYGWDDNPKDHPASQQTVQAFLDYIGTYFVIGVYTSAYFWRNYIGTGYRTSHPFVLWLTGCHLCNSITSAPCNPNAAGTQGQVNNALNAQPPITQVVLGGSQMVLWQYYISDPSIRCQDNSNPSVVCENCGCYHPNNDPNQFADWDVAIQDPKIAFIPIQSSQAYNDAACPAPATPGN